MQWEKAINKCWTIALHNSDNISYSLRNENERMQSMLQEEKKDPLADQMGKNSGWK